MRNKAIGSYISQSRVSPQKFFLKKCQVGSFNERFSSLESYGYGNCRICSFARGEGGAYNEKLEVVPCFLGVVPGYSGVVPRYQVGVPGYLGGFLWYIGSVRLVEVVRVVEVIGVAELIGEVQGG